ncbi:glycosyltransferase family 1 protein [Blautia sp.]
MKILQIGMGNVAGGLEAFVMNYYRVLVHKDVQFDFVCMYDKIAYEEEIRRLGGRIYYIPNVKKNYRGYVRELKRILKETKYDVVHVNMLSAANIVPLRMAHKMGVPKVIAHSHSSSCPGFIRKTMDQWNRPKIARYATDRVACGEMAGRWLFGDKAYQNGEVVLINNAIYTEWFSFSSEKRTELRKEMGWEGKTVIGHVGRFDIPKNHDRMVDIMNCLSAKDKNVVLCLIGPKEGLYGQIREKVQKAGLEDQIFFAGKQENVPRYLSAMDVFLFPSLFEGVPFALIEAQANGLPCVMSDAVSEEAVVFSENVRRLSLQIEDKIWADTLMEMSRLERKSQNVIHDRMQEAHFDITTEAERLRKLYLGNR